MNESNELDELEWRIDYLKNHYSLDEQIVENEPDLSNEEKETFEEEMIYLKEWIKALKDNRRKMNEKSLINEKNKDKINWKIDFLKNSIESVKASIRLNPHLDQEDLEFFEHDSKNLKKWLNEIQEEFKELEKTS